MKRILFFCLLLGQGHVLGATFGDFLGKHQVIECQERHQNVVVSSQGLCKDQVSLEISQSAEAYTITFKDQNGSETSFPLKKEISDGQSENYKSSGFHDSDYAAEWVEYTWAKKDVTDIKSFSIFKTTKGEKVLTITNELLYDPGRGEVKDHQVQIFSLK